MNNKKAFIFCIVVCLTAFLEVTYLDGAMNKWLFYICMTVLWAFGMRTLCYDTAKKK